MGSCGHEFKKCGKTFKAIISRILFILFCIFAVWRVTEQSVFISPTHLSWLLLFLLVPLLLESLYAWWHHSQNQLKWVMPHVFFFLVCAIPCMWLLELSRHQPYLQDDGRPSDCSNTTNTATLRYLINLHCLEDRTWLNALQQILLFVVIVAKWIAPKGELTAVQLSGILLINIAAGADILDLSGLINEDEKVLQAVKGSGEQGQQELPFVYGILSVWTLSLLHFPINLTATKEVKGGKNYQLEEVVTAEGGVARSNTQQRPVRELYPCDSFVYFIEFSFYNELWGMIVGILLLDLPFLITRAVILFSYRNVVTATNIFFFFKNVVVIALLFNRIRIYLKEDWKPWLENRLRT